MSKMKSLRQWLMAITLMSSASMVLSSCIRDEALNAEADITSIILDSTQIKPIGEPVITNDEVKVYVNGWDDLTKLSPSFTLTPGATIDPANGTVRDFTQPQTYTVTSEDGNWSKKYTVSFLSNDVPTDFSFENVRQYKYVDEWDPEADSLFYQIFYDTIDGTTTDWGSGNAGFMITDDDKNNPASYPTQQSDNGYKGKCVKLETKSTGALGKMFGAPIAAGNLFIGDFVLDISSPAKSTHFGRPFRKEPLVLTGWYKYKAGSVFTDKNMNELKDRHDSCDIYAVMYEATDDVPYLDGTNIKTSKNIVSIAEAKEWKETDNWTFFLIPFKAVNGKTFDAAKLASGKYRLAIVMSSSRHGADFEGAVGSTLYVDEVHVYSKGDF
ncbi:PCMD domain-containing protein [Prevotella sp. AGR2160]|uniref:PCMD domain-containing protein n=1 Tax=Prevotella sp. AGR2160 TaxID=1280674 RepID=UPI0003F80482|nr:PCMD domain-containing protein [Prevotella sp. AGR2160]